MTWATPVGALVVPDVVELGAIVSTVRSEGNLPNRSDQNVTTQVLLLTEVLGYEVRFV